MSRETTLLDHPFVPASPDHAAAIPAVLALLPVRRIVLFPGLVVTLTVDDLAARKLFEESLPKERIIGLFTRKPGEPDQPGVAGLCRVGVAAHVLKLNREDDGTLKATVSLLARIAVHRALPFGSFLQAEIEVLAPVGPAQDDNAWRAVVQELRDHARQYVQATPELPAPTAGLVRSLEDPGQLADLMAASLPLSTGQKQDLLEQLDVPRRVRAVLVFLSDQLEIARLRRKIDEDVAAHFTATQRRAFLREQLNTIRKELGEEGFEQQANELRRHIEAAHVPPAVLDYAGRELHRLPRLPPNSSEASLTIAYLELLSELPWNRTTEDNLDLARARQILDRDHFDLDKIKRRLVEFLAVCKLNPTRPSPVLCLAGPPGVGKTSLGQSIADAVREIGQVVESVQTADEVMRQAERAGVELPISSAVRAVLHGELTPSDGLRQLLSRQQKPEYPSDLFG